MGRFPIDQELGSPKFHLRGSDILLMDKSIVCKYRDIHHNLEPYEWMNYDPFTISSIELAEPTDKITGKIAILGSINSRLTITVIYGFFLLLSYQFSIFPWELMVMASSEGFAYWGAIILAIILVGWDYIYYGKLTENLKIRPVINVYMSGKNAPEILSNDKKLTITEFSQNLLILITRTTLVIGVLAMTSGIEIIEGVEFLVRIFIFILTVILVIPIVFFQVLLPTNISQLRRYYSSEYSKVPSLEIREFHHQLVQEWDNAKQNHKTPLADLITGKEMPEVEFKASYWTNADDIMDKNLLLQDAVIKVVAGFMNSKKGGHLIIGIQDNTRKPTGLVDADINQLKTDPSWDQLERHIVATLNNNLSSGTSILANESYVLREEIWPQNKDGERIIHIHIPNQAKMPVYALQKETQKMKLKKWRNNEARKPESERHPREFIPDHLKPDYKFRFLREQTSTSHQSREDWDKHWHGSR